MDRAWSAIERVLEAASLVAMASLVGLPFLQVILRDVFSSPIVGLEEATRFGLITLVFLAVPLLIRTSEQIRLTEFISPLPARLRGLLERATLVAGAACYGIVAAAGLGSALKNASTRTPTLDIPFWLFVSPMVGGLAAAALGCLWYGLRREKPPLGEGSVVI